MLSPHQCPEGSEQRLRELVPMIPANPAIGQVAPRD